MMKVRGDLRGSQCASEVVRLRLQDEPIEAISRQRQHVGKLADRREGGGAGELDREPRRHSARKSSSTAWAERARLNTQSSRWSSYSRTKASTLRLRG